MRSFAIGERDRLLRVFTNTRGVIAVVARGARASPNRFGASVLTGACSELVLSDNPSGLSHVAGVALRQLFASPDPAVQDLVYRMLGHVSVLPDDAPQPAVYAELRAALHALLSEPVSPAVVMLAFRLRFLKSLGQCPDFDRCLGCGVRVDGTAWLAADGLGCQCTACASGGASGRGEATAEAGEVDRCLDTSWVASSATARPIDAAARRLIRYLLDHHPRLAGRLRLEGGQARQLSRLVETLIGAQLDLPRWMQRAPLVAAGELGGQVAGGTRPGAGR